MQGQGKSRRWRYGDYRRHKAVARLFARRRASSTRGGSDGAGIAGSFASAVTERSARLGRSYNAGSGCRAAGVKENRG